MWRLDKFKKRTIISITIIFAIVIVCVLKFTIFTPKPITEIKLNTVYIGGAWLYYPEKHQSRYYIEFKKNNKFILTFDKSRGDEDDYYDDAGYHYPFIEIDFGTYEIENGNYVLTTKKSAIVKFKDTEAVKQKKINLYGQGSLKDEYFRKYFETVGEKRVFFAKNRYVLGYSNAKNTSYDKKVGYYLLYNKSDIKDLPDTPEEFRKQFKMDKKAEKERLEKEKN